VRRPTARSAVCGATVDERDRDKTRVAYRRDSRQLDRDIAFSMKVTRG
jgi:hypothetical protein